MVAGSSSEPLSSRVATSRFDIATRTPQPPGGNSETHSVGLVIRTAHDHQTPGSDLDAALDNVIKVGAVVSWSPVQHVDRDPHEHIHCGADSDGIPAYRELVDNRLPRPRAPKIGH